jgi:hypothetical protein
MTKGRVAGVQTIAATINPVLVTKFGVSRCLRLFGIRHSVFRIRYYLLHISTSERGFCCCSTCLIRWRLGGRV